MIQEDAEALRKKYRENIDALTPIFARAAVGDFSEKVKIPENPNDEFLDLYAGIEILLEVVRKRIQEEEAAKTQIISLASHQFRTPLSVIKWYISELRNNETGPLNKEQEHLANIIAVTVDRMSTLVDNLLNISRIELGTYTMSTEKRDIVEIIKQVVKEFETQFKHKHVNFSFTANPNIPHILIDPSIIVSSIQNVLSNSSKYSKTGGKVELRIYVEGDNVIISVSDDGYGIPEDEKKYIFTKLYRAANVRKRVLEGTGLGLYLVKSILEHANAEIYFESSENVGSTFYISIPLTGMRQKTLMNK